MRRERLAMALFMLLMGLFCVVQNLQNALGNAAHFSGGQSDHRKGEQATAQLRQSQLKQLTTRRAEQAKVAGEEAPASITAELERVKAADSRRWQSTAECDPAKITAGESKAFCANIASLKAKMAAATERDALDGKIAAISTKLEDAGTPPASVDPFADNVALAASVVGIEMSAHAKEVASSLKDLIKAIVLELMAAFGPSAILALLRPAQRSHSEPKSEEAPQQKTASPARERAPATIAAVATIVRKSSAPVAQTEMVAATPAENDAPMVAATVAADPVAAFLATKLEARSGEHMPAGEVWRLYCEFCEAKGIETGTQKAFGGRAKSLLGWENNGNRPRYLNVRKRESSALRLAVSNT